MEIKLIIMRKIVYVFVAFFLFSCAVTDRNIKYIKDFKEDFKVQAYCSCLIQGYGNKKISSEMVKVDKSFFSPYINSIYSKDLFEIGVKEAIIIKNDSLNSVKVVSEASAGKKVIIHCLNFYKSKRLDSITKIKFKQWKKIKNLDTIMANKYPAY